MNGILDEHLKGRALKKKVLECIQNRDVHSCIEDMRKLPGRRVVNPLFSLLHDTDPRIKWPAVKAMGRVVADLAERDMEEARVVMRRFIWNLNDESGGIGWGCPESMGEAMACHEGLAEEYATILGSYAREDQNYLEHEMLQRGVLWGIARLARVRPHLFPDARLFILPHLASPDPVVRGLAARIAGIFKMAEAEAELTDLLSDQAEVEIFSEDRLETWKVMDLAREALVTTHSKQEETR